MLTARCREPNTTVAYKITNTLPQRALLIAGAILACWGKHGWQSLRTIAAGVFLLKLIFVCHLTGLFHSGGNAHPRQDDGLQKIPGGNKADKNQYFIHRITLLAWCPGQRVRPPPIVFEQSPLQ